MSFLISNAFAQSGGDTGSGLLGLLPLVLIFVLFYFLLIRPQQKRQKKHREMVATLEVGDEVVTNGGAVGIIRATDENFVAVEVAPNVVVQVQRQAIAQLMPDKTYRPYKASKPKPRRRKKKKVESDSE